MSSAFVELSLARFRSYWREPSILFWSFGFPMVLAVALGIAFRNRPPEPVEVAVESSCSEETQHAITSNAALRGRVLAPSAAEQSLRTGGVTLVVACDGGASSYHFDETRPDARNARLVVHDVLERAAGRTDRTTPADVRVTEPGARYIDFLIPGLIGSNIMSAGLWGLGFTLVDMRVRNLLKRLAATPMKKRDFLASWTMVRAVLVCIELPLLLLFAKLAFGVTVQGSLPLLLVVCLLGSIVFAGFGMLVASRAKNTQTVSGLINLVSMPMYLCSGVFFSAERFPPAVLPWVRALPLTALIDSMRGIMTEGQGIREVAPRMAVTLAWGVGVFVVALRGFRWR